MFWDVVNGVPYEELPGNKVRKCMKPDETMIFLHNSTQKNSIVSDLAETLRNEAFELYLGVGFD